MKLNEITQPNKPLYVSRKLLNAKELYLWAKLQGWDKPLKPEDMHVTVVSSKDPINWTRLTPQTNTLIVKPINAAVKIFGENKNSAVFTFECSELHARWQQFLDIGASWDHGAYTPHVSLTYNHGYIDQDLDTMPMFFGDLILGPEIYEDLNLDWSANKN